MAVGLTRKQEKFIQAYMEEDNASEAYRLCYNTENSTAKTVWEAASRLMADAKVKARLEELRAINAKRNEVTIESISKELDEARDMGRDNEQSAAMTTAILGKAKLHGLMTDKLKVDGDISGNFRITVGYE
jgi:phage terminase small subunit